MFLFDVLNIIFSFVTIYLTNITHLCIDKYTDSSFLYTRTKVPDKEFLGHQKLISWFSGPPALVFSVPHYRFYHHSNKKNYQMRPLRAPKIKNTMVNTACN
jgi:hypothetical protein